MGSQNTKIIGKLFDFYLIQNYHYLIQLPAGHYITMNNRDKPIRRYMLMNHLSGKTTVGTFAGAALTKFISFDVDFRDLAIARWVTYKIADALDRAGVGYAVSFSGGKGYHVDVFLDKAISIESARRFYDFIIKSSEIAGIEGGEVEYRPAATQGIKLPLGVHQKTGQYCGYCRIEDGLTVMGPEESAVYFMALQKTDHTVILDILAEHVPAYETKEAGDMENAIARYKPLETYDQSESYTLSRAAERYEKGLTGPGQRHKSFLLLARFMNHHGIDRGEAEERIGEWLSWQDPRYYSSDADFCAKDIRECVAYIYDNNLTLMVEQKELTVTFGEIDAIIKMCPQKNQKALAYAMLIHGKRWAGPAGTFYMTYKQMEETAGIGENTVGRQLAKLEELGVIEFVRRNQKQKGTPIKRPNIYRMTLRSSSDGREDRGLFSLEEGRADIGDCLKHFYDDKELRSVLPRRQYTALTS